MGDHTDYTGGLVLPMAIQLGTTVAAEPRDGLVVLRSHEVQGTVRFELPVPDPSSVEPLWGRYVAGVAQVLRPAHGLIGTVSSTLPIGAGLSSSAALEVAVALALGFDGPPLELALACRDAEALATGVPCGVMDQLTSAAGVAGHALLIDCSALTVTPIEVPSDVEVVVVHSGRSRALAGSPYATRRAECERAEEVVGPLRRAMPSDLRAIADPLLRARARHVVTENARVAAFAAALQTGDLTTCGELMAESHHSLASDFEVSTTDLDDLVARLVARPGVIGARLTGAGFGGCVVALARPGVLEEGWSVVPSAGARVLG